MEKVSGIQATESRNLAAGAWKFAPTVREDVLINLAIAWKNAEPDRYLDLHVRPYGKKGWAIGFIYRFDGPDHQKFFYETSDKLKRQFGNELTGYDVASPIWRIA